MRLRLLLYERGYIKPCKLKAKVISVGNITVGGTGKTPIVEYLARSLSRNGCKVAVLTRGYKRKNTRCSTLIVSSSSWVEEAGDEPMMLARKLDGVSVIVDSDRCRSGLLAIEQLASEVLLLDDGFQHLRLERDLDILVLDATDLFGGGKMIPFGRLREPLSGMRRADVIIVTRSHKGVDELLLLDTLAALNMNDRPIFRASYRFVRLADCVTDRVVELERLNGRKVAALCAIARPDVFFEDLCSYGAKVVLKAAFPDHYFYRQADVDSVFMSAIAAGADCVVTTQKDQTKLRGLVLGKLPVYVVELELTFDEELRFRELISSYVDGFWNLSYSKA